MLLLVMLRSAPNVKLPSTMQEELRLDAPEGMIPADAASAMPKYVMRVSRMTVDKLGFRLYDTVSAVVAELFANAYDADATKVIVRLPLATALARKTQETGEWEDVGYAIDVVDDGHGLTQEEANEYFLQVGRERRNHVGQGPRSRKLQRRVMGRKGIGKLAPFGICRRIEVISAGGAPIGGRYKVAHFVMDYDKIVADSDQSVPLDPGALDGTSTDRSGTTIRLSNFYGKKVPNADVFLRQMARRFIPTGGFEMFVDDVRPEELRDGEPELHSVGLLDVPIQDVTRLDLSQHPVTTELGIELPVSGWLALAKEAYKDEETTGVRIYARNKIVGWTRDFEQPAGYTGEFTMRSYLVGEVVAEWLDLDNGEDLVKTDRQGIIWESEYGSAFRKWGAESHHQDGDSIPCSATNARKEYFSR